MKSKPTNVQANGTWESKFGLMYQFDIEMEDGNIGQYSSPKYTNKDSDDFPFKVGEEREYVFEAHEKFPKIKLPKKDFQPSFQFNGKQDTSRELMITRQSSLARAVEVLTHNTDKIKADDVITLANKFTKWVMKEEAKATPKVEVKVEPTPEPIPEPISETDDLPF
tara:strand:+ start:1473 stop:1970 length:498 start_codon:yes stop_codon:yes gene_type:complete